MTRLGMIARADNSGLGTLTWEFYRHMKPDRTLVVDLSEHRPTMRSYMDRYADAEWIKPLRGSPLDFGADFIDAFLHGLDVLYTAETFYDNKIIERARALGVETVVHVMPEYCDWIANVALPKPDRFLAPTDWMLPELEKALDRPVEVLPVPVARDRLIYRRRDHEARRIVHSLGSGAALDRNGTNLIAAAFRHIYTPGLSLIYRQGSDNEPPKTKVQTGLRVEVEKRIEDYADLWKPGYDLAVVPRRYGGLSLPLQEAMACGLPVIALDREPERSMLPALCLVPSHVTNKNRWSGLSVEISACEPRALATRIEEIAYSPELMAEISDASNAYAERISWEKLLPLYRSTLQ